MRTTRRGVGGWRVKGGTFGCDVTLRFWDVVVERHSDRRAIDAWRTKIPSDGDGFGLRELSRPYHGSKFGFGSGKEKLAKRSARFANSYLLEDSVSGYWKVWSFWADWMGLNLGCDIGA
jgi:hypothetical protein